MRHSSTHTPNGKKLEHTGGRGGNRRYSSISEHARFALTLAVLLSSVGLGASFAHAAIPASERAVLQNLYAYTDGPDWATQTGWNGPPGTECSWYGITCDASGTTVTGIDLSGNGLYGSLPPLDGLPNLESFEIYQTATGGIGPYNSLFGPIPSLNGLKSLKSFDANNTNFSGGIPSLTGLTSLQMFDCSRCGLGGSIPSLSGLVNLQYFDVSYNHLTGNMPSLAGLANLATFNVESNFLTGPSLSLAGLDSLSEFAVDTNLLTGSVPDLSGLSNLHIFSVDFNLMDGSIGDLSGLPHLSVFDVGNNLLTGDIPSLSDLSNLQTFLIGGNRLNGGVPNLSGLTGLQAFDIGHNQLTGALPAPPSESLRADLCPNLLTPASTPPSDIDLSWNTATGTTPWSQDCVPDPVWKTTLNVFTSLNPSTVGQPVTFRAVVYGMNPTGTVTFTSKSEAPDTTAVTTLCSGVSLIDSTATCTVDNIPVSNSTYSIIGHYSGDTGNAAADNSIVPIHQYIESPPIVATITSNPVQVGEPVDIAGTGSFGGSSTTTMEFDHFHTPVCSAVPVYQVDGQQRGRCITQFATPGPYWLMVNSTSDGGSGPGDSSLPLIVNVVAATPFDADQFALTGSWYNPPTSGQGLEIEVYPDLAGSGKGLLFGGWFTYDNAGHPRWMVLQGNLSDAHGGSYQLQVGQGQGGNFNAAPVVSANAVGSATLSFYDCTHAALTYSLNDGSSGTIPYVRLTSPSGCSPTVPAVPMPLQANENDVLHSGAWYSPTTSGQGLVVDVVPSMTTFFAAWYTYAPATSSDTGEARQRWFTLQYNSYTPGNLDLQNVPIVAATGGLFDQSSTVSLQQVGTAEVKFISCSTMQLTYTFTSGEFAGLTGTINEQAVAANVGCR